MDQTMSELYGASEDELYFAIGKALVEDELGFLPPNVKGLEERGRRWFNSRIDSIQQAVCFNETIRGLASNGFSSELVAAVAGLVEALSLGSAASPLVILLCKKGLNELCQEHWKVID